MNTPAPHPEDVEVCRRIRERYGLAVDTLDELINSDHSYGFLAESMLDWFPEMADPRIRDGMVRAITSKNLPDAAVRRLITLFESLPQASYLDMDLKWVIGNAIQVGASPAHVPDILRLCRDKRFGWARGELPLILSRVPDRELAEKVAIELSTDSDLQRSAVIVLRKLGTEGAISRLRELAKLPGEVGKSAQRALKRKS